MSKTRQPGPLKKGHKKNFETLQRAHDEGALCIMSAIRKSDGEQVALVCAMNFDGEFYMPVPLAEMVNGNPYELYEDPTVIDEEE
jgi:hypothetical protein